MPTRPSPSRSSGHDGVYNSALASDLLPLLLGHTLWGVSNRWPPAGSPAPPIIGPIMVLRFVDIQAFGQSAQPGSHFDTLTERGLE